MARAQSEANQLAMKAAQKKLGMKPPKHTPAEMVDTIADGKAVYLPSQLDNQATDGDCAVAKPVVESGFSIFNQGTPIMTDAKHDSNHPETKPSPAQLEKEAAAKKKAEDAATKKEAAAAKAAEAKAARETAAKERADTIAANKAKREAAAQAAKEAGRTYTGSMLQLADRVKQGAYVKGLNGQLRSSDELALALDAVPPANVVKLGLKVLGLDSNPYAALNIGQQSMNLRNRMRGAIKKGTLKLADVIAVRDVDGLATAEAEVAKKKEAAAAREKARLDAKAAKEAADAPKVEAEKPAKKKPNPAVAATGHAA